jgi:hypothetical protein
MIPRNLAGWIVYPNGESCGSINSGPVNEKKGKSNCQRDKFPPGFGEVYLQISVVLAPPPQNNTKNRSKNDVIVLHYLAVANGRYLNAAKSSWMENRANSSFYPVEIPRPMPKSAKMSPARVRFLSGMLLRNLIVH